MSHYRAFVGAGYDAVVTSSETITREEIVFYVSQILLLLIHSVASWLWN